MYLLMELIIHWSSIGSFEKGIPHLNGHLVVLGSKVSLQSHFINLVFSSLVHYFVGLSL